jgi:hypothetical protein
VRSLWDSLYVEAASPTRRGRKKNGIRLAPTTIPSLLALELPWWPTPLAKEPPRANCADGARESYLGSSEGGGGTLP